MSIEVPHSARPGVHGNIFRNAKTGPALSGFGGSLTLYDVFQHTVKRFPDNPCIGHRPIDAKGRAGDYIWLTYSETSQRATDFAAGLTNLKLCPPVEDFKSGVLGFYAKNRIEWTIGEQACARMNIVPIPLYDTLGVESVAYVVDQVLLCTCLCTTEVATNLLQAAEKGTSTLRNIVLMDAHSETDERLAKVRAESKKRTGSMNEVKIFSWSSVESAGKEKPVRPYPPGPLDVAFFCYTSGTTGAPKGGMITHQNMVSGLAAVINGDGSFVVRNDGSSVHLSYLPLPHVFERMNQMCIFAYGGRVGYYQGDPLKILDDLVTLKPTFFP